jgi:sugar porter (SP) family MFS transporter
MTDKHLSKRVPRNYKLFFACVTVLTMVHPTTLGYDSSMMGGILNLDSYLSYFDLTPVTIGLNNAATWMGGMIAGMTFIQYVNDHFGRKKSIFLGMTIITIGAILQSAAQNMGMFIVGRILNGMGTCTTSVSSIILVAELVPPQIRGFLMGLAFSSFLIGGLISSGVTYGCRNISGNWNWRVPSIIQVSPTILALINLIFLPESPKFLLSKFQDTKALETLLIVHKNDMEKATEILDAYKLELEVEKRLVKNPWRLFFKSRINVHKAMINVSHAFLTEMAGSSVGTYYLSILLQQAGITSSTERLQVNVVMSAWQLVCAIAGCTCFDKLGRKRQSMASLTGMVVMFMLLGGLIKKFGDGHSKSGSYGAITVMFLFSGMYSFTFTPLTSLYPSELYSFKMRSAGVVVYQFFNNGFGLVSSFVLPIAMTNIGWKYYIVNAAYDVLFIPVIYYVWIETKGEDIELIDEKFWAHPFNKGKMPPVIKKDESDSDVVEVQSVEIVNKV